MRIKVAIVMTLTALSCVSHAAEKEIWACRTENPQAQPILHLVDWGERSYIKFAHVRFAATHQMDEQSEGWYWNNEGNGYYRYGMLLQPDGEAWFHDFADTDQNGLSAPLDRFTCRRTS
jgi:hypothetical protein